MTKKSFIISVFTVFTQYYDYHLFGFLASNIALYFFPADEIITQLLNTYLLMTVAMISKPIGAVVLGRIGDLYGRSVSLKISLFGTAISSFVLFIAPSYEIVGILSAFILLICRMGICAFVSSGSDGVRIYVYEHINKSRRCLGIGITALFTQAGSLTASISALVFTQNYLPDYAWRFTFLIGSILGIILVITMQISKFSDTKKSQENDEEFKRLQNLSLKQIIRNNYLLFFVCIALAGSIGSTTQFLIIFFGTYNFEILNIVDRSLMQQYISMAIFSYMIFSVIAGYLADRFGEYKIIKLGVIIVLIFSLVLCIQISNLIFSGVVFITIVTFMPFITMPAAAIFKESIPIAIRYRIFSLSHAIGSVIISAPTAFLSATLYRATNTTWIPLIYFIITVIMIFFAIYYLLKRKVSL